MPLYTIIMDFEGGTYIRQVIGKGPVDALEFWARNPDPEMLAGIKQRNRSTWAKDLIAEIESGVDVVVPITGAQSAWCRSFLQGRKLALVNIVQTELPRQDQVSRPLPKTLHVVFGLSAAGSIRDALKRTDRSDKVVGLIDDFSYGPTDPADIDARQTFVEDILGCDFEDDDVRKMRATFWRKSLDAKRRRIVWLSRWSAMEYCNFLAWLERNGDAPFELVDLTDSWLPSSSDPSISKPVECISLVGSDQFVRYGLWDRGQTFTERQRRDAMRLWFCLREESAPLRVITPEGLASAPIEHFDEALMSHIGEGWTNAWRVVGRALGAMMYDSFREGGVYQCGDILLLSRLRTLVDQGILLKKGRLTSAKFQVRRPD